jgi:dTMP kinase
VLLLDLDVEEGLKRNRTLDAGRSTARGTKTNRFETDSLEFHRRVRQGFLQLAKREPQRFEVLDARLPADELHERIKAAVAQRLGLK